MTGANGTRIRVAVIGSGPLVLMVHGFPELVGRIGAEGVMRHLGD
jgi:hypothetical protein